VSRREVRLSPSRPPGNCQQLTRGSVPENAGSPASRPCDLCHSVWPPSQKPTIKAGGERRIAILTRSPGEKQRQNALLPEGDGHNSFALNERMLERKGECQGLEIIKEKKIRSRRN